MEYTMNRPSYLRRAGFAWFELLLALCLLSLILQLAPFLIVHADFRQWSHTTWCWTNFAAVIVLIGIRFVPGIIKDYMAGFEARDAEKKRTQAALALKNERETLEKMKQSRRRRMY
jgi:hypothetical protein